MTSNQYIVLIDSSMVGERVSLTYKTGLLTSPFSEFIEQFDFELIDIYPYNNGFGLRFFVTDEKSEGGPLVIEDRLIFNKTIMILQFDGYSVPFLSEEQANDWVDFICKKQDEWVKAYHNGFLETLFRLKPKNGQPYN